jgi:ABC-type multidrug transport system fused ATPase/permease subunit
MRRYLLTSSCSKIRPKDVLMKGKTFIVIAHHLATIQSVDAIFVVKDNALVERGTHDELLAAGGLYSELYEIQFRNEEPQAATALKS